jgi:hypothetical protein
MLQKNLLIAIANVVMVWSSFAIGAPNTSEQAHLLPDTGSEPLSLARAIELSLKNNQALAGLQAKAEALGAVPAQVGA